MSGMSRRTLLQSLTGIAAVIGLSSKVDASESAREDLQQSTGLDGSDGWYLVDANGVELENVARFSLFTGYCLHRVECDRVSLSDPIRVIEWSQWYPAPLEHRYRKPEQGIVESGDLPAIGDEWPWSRKGA